MLVKHSGEAVDEWLISEQVNNSQFEGREMAIFIRRERTVAKQVLNIVWLGIMKPTIANQNNLPW